MSHFYVVVFTFPQCYWEPEKCIRVNFATSGSRAPSIEKTNNDTVGGLPTAVYRAKQSRGNGRVGIKEWHRIEWLPFLLPAQHLGMEGAKSFSRSLKTLKELKHIACAGV